MRRPSNPYMPAKFKRQPRRLPAAPPRRPRALPVLRCDWCGKAYVPDRHSRPGQGTFCTPQHRLKAWRRRQAKVARPAAAEGLPHVEELQAAPPIKDL